MFVLCQVSIGHSPFGCRIIGKRPDPFLLFFFRDVQEEFDNQIAVIGQLSFKSPNIGNSKLVVFFDNSLCAYSRVS